jgi:hypothetical protein
MIVTNEIKIEFAVQKDAEAISKLALQSRIFVYPVWIYCLLISLSCVFAVRRKNKLIGFVSFLYIPYYLSYVMQIAIDKNHQKIKIGSVLLYWTTFYLQEKLKVPLVLLHTVKKYVADWMNKMGFKTFWKKDRFLWLLYKRP